MTKLGLPLILRVCLLPVAGNTHAFAGDGRARIRHDSRIRRRDLRHGRGVPAGHAVPRQDGRPHVRCDGPRRALSAGPALGRVSKRPRGRVHGDDQPRLARIDRTSSVLLTVRSAPRQHRQPPTGLSTSRASAGPCSSAAAITISIAAWLWRCGTRRKRRHREECVPAECRASRGERQTRRGSQKKPHGHGRVRRHSDGEGCRVHRVIRRSHTV